MLMIMYGSTTDTIELIIASAPASHQCIYLTNECMNQNPFWKRIALGAVVGGRCGQPIEPTTELTDVNLDTPPLTPPEHPQYGEPPEYAAVQTEEDTPLQKV